MFPILNGKKILLGVTGGIAAYKACGLVRLFKKNGASVKVIMTDAAMEFVQPLTFETLSESMVYTKMFGNNNKKSLEHISLTRWADCIVIAPATANCCAKLAHGIADDLLSTVLIAANIPICLAPAMNKEMWVNDATQNNIRILKSRNIQIFGPANGYQACGEIGDGRMLEPMEIAELTSTLFITPLLMGKKVMVTAGPTIEPIDPVRYISNHSSGKMGYAIAEAAAKLAAKVIMISGPTQLSTPFGVERRDVKTAIDMYKEVMEDVLKCDIFISVAAAADYRVETISAEKIKKTAEILELKLVKNPDILLEVAKLPSPPITVGFAAETQDILLHAREKLKNKNLDIIIANEVGENKGFEKENNALTVLTRDGREINLGQKSKSKLAIDLMKIVCDYAEIAANKQMNNSASLVVK